MSKKTSISPTQQQLPIAGIQDGVVLMNDGSVRAVLKIEPINFDLKSETEQNGIIYSYQGFLNSLDFPIQIIIQSKKLDLERYLANLDESRKGMTNDLLRIQTEDYVEFVRRLISIANIMSKRFYVVVSYSAVTKETSSASFMGMFHRNNGPVLEQKQFERFRGEVFNRANLIAGGLSRLGLRVGLLETQQLIELFYGIYNPDIATEERLTDISNLNAGVVSSYLSNDNEVQIAEAAATAGMAPAPTMPAPIPIPNDLQIAPIVAPVEGTDNPNPEPVAPTPPLEPVSGPFEEPPLEDSVDNSPSQPTQ
jgi:hypothetical protein